MNFTFKTTKPTGKYRSFFPASHEIKLKGMVVGVIKDNSIFTIRLMVIKKDIMEDGNPNCEWKWITLKKESSSLYEAKSFLKLMYDKITKKYVLRVSD